MGIVSYPVYVYLSNHGELFVPAIDTTSFPALHPIGMVEGLVQKAAQRAFGIRAPDVKV
jgi:hypothetical protein